MALPAASRAPHRPHHSPWSPPSPFPEPLEPSLLAIAAMAAATAVELRSNPSSPGLLPSFFHLQRPPSTPRSRPSPLPPPLVAVGREPRRCPSPPSAMSSLPLASVLPGARALRRRVRLLLLSSPIGRARRGMAGAGRTSPRAGDLPLLRGRVGREEGEARRRALTTRGARGPHQSAARR